MKRIGLLVVALGVLLVSSCTSAAPAPPTATPLPTPDHSILAIDKRKEAPVEAQESIVYTLPGMDQVTIANIEYKEGLTMDVYYPPDFDFTHNLPVVILVNGFKDEEFQQWWSGCKLKDHGLFVSWAQLVAASGMIAISYETQNPNVDVRDLIDYTRANAPLLRVDGDRICLSGRSSTPQTALVALTITSAEYRDSLVCAVFLYGDLSIGGNLGERLPPDTAFLIVKGGRDDHGVNGSIDLFVEKAREAGFPVEFIEYEDGVHGYDAQQDTDESREIIKRTLEFIKMHLFEE